MGTTSVDPYALRFAAQRLDEAADLLDAALSRHLSGLRLLAADGATRSAVGGVVEGVARWQRTAREYASVVRAGADRYTDEDRDGAEALR
jgi:hypothetical protein